MPAAHEPRPAAPATAAGPQPVPANRRSRVRLRDLCDEVLASHRAARERDLITDADRQAAAQVLAGLAPARGDRAA